MISRVIKSLAKFKAPIVSKIGKIDDNDYIERVIMRDISDVTSNVKIDDIPCIKKAMIAINTVDKSTYDGFLLTKGDTPIIEYYNVDTILNKDKKYLQFEIVKCICRD
jgi:hypothetical protein